MVNLIYIFMSCHYHLQRTCTMTSSNKSTKQTTSVQPTYKGMENDDMAHTEFLVFSIIIAEGRLQYSKK